MATSSRPSPHEAGEPAESDLRLTLSDDRFDTAVATFSTRGAFVARGLLPTALLDDVRAEIRRLIALAHRARGLTPPGGEPFDDGFVELCAEDAAAGQEIFGACRRLPAVHRLSVHPRLLALSRRLMNTDMVMVPPYKPVRIDHTPRQGALLPWHQDYPYAQDSPDGVVYWIPLIDVHEGNGCLEVAPGSHAEGIRDVVMLEPPPGHDVRGLRWAADGPGDAYAPVRLPMAADEVLVLSALLMHRSRPNQSPRARWTVQVRHGNFAHPTAMAKGWPRGHYERHWFDETHPEHVAGREPFPGSDA